MRLIAGVRCCAFALIASACRDTAPPVADRATPADSADQFMVGMDTFVHEMSLKRARLRADTAYFFDDHKRVEMRGVSGEFYTSTGALDARLTARRGTVDTRTQAMEAFGDVVLVNVEGRTLRTPHLSYDKSMNEVRSDSAFTVTGPDGEFAGIGFTSDPSLTFIRVKQNVRGSPGAIRVPGR